MSGSGSFVHSSEFKVDESETRTVMPSLLSSVQQVDCGAVVAGMLMLIVQGSACVSAGVGSKERGGGFYIMATQGGLSNGHIDTQVKLVESAAVMSDDRAETEAGRRWPGVMSSARFDGSPDVMARGAIERLLSIVTRVTVTCISRRSSVQHSESAADPRVSA